MKIRRFSREDLDALHLINEESVPGVGTLTRDRLDRLVADNAATFVAVDAGGKPAGFVLVMLEGLGLPAIAGDLMVLLAWLSAGWILAVKTFRWE